MNVSAIIVTRGDQDLTAITQSLPDEWQVILWNNGEKVVEVSPQHRRRPVSDLSVYGRYAAIEYASGDLIYVQDDDCVVNDPQAIVGAWWERWHYAVDTHPMGGDKGVVCNMPQPFRHDFYQEHSLVGFGAVFHRDAFDRAMKRFANGSDEAAATLAGSRGDEELMWWRRTCDIVFTALTPRVLVDVPYRNLPWAEDETRMYRQNGHVAERTRMLELVRKVRDGT